MTGQRAPGIHRSGMLVVASLALVGLPGGYGLPWSRQPSIAAEALTAAGAPSRAPAWHPRDDRIAFERQVDGRWGLFVVDVETRTEQRLDTGRTGSARYPAWSPDGRSLAFVTEQTGGSQLTSLHVGDGTIRIHDTPSGEVLFPAWSQDGAALAYAVRTGERFTLWTTPIGAGQPRPLLSVTGRDVWPRWAPVGGTLAFFSRRADHPDDDEIYLVTGSDAPRRLTTRPGHDFSPAWHPDGDHLAVVSVEADGTQTIRVVTKGGRTGPRLVSGFYRATEPTWSPDGLRVAFAGVERKGGSYRIYVAAAPVER